MIEVTPTDFQHTSFGWADSKPEIISRKERHHADESVSELQGTMRGGIQVL